MFGDVEAPDTVSAAHVSGEAVRRRLSEGPAQTLLDQHGGDPLLSQLLPQDQQLQLVIVQSRQLICVLCLFIPLGLFAYFKHEQDGRVGRRGSLRGGDGQRECSGQGRKGGRAA